MKKLILAAFLVAAASLAQSPNPQPTYAQTMTILHPSTWLRFNGASATTFTDAIAGNNFSTTATTNAFSVVTAAFPVQNVVLNGDVAPAGALQSVTIQFFTTPTAGQSVSIVIAHDGGGNNFTVTDSFTVTVAATTAQQTFHVGTDFSARNIPSGSHLGYWVGAGLTQVACNNSTAPPGMSVYFFAPASSVPVGSQNYTPIGNAQNGLSATVTALGAVTPLQAGFDTAQANNFSIAMSHDSWAVASSSTTGDYEWSDPFSLYIHINKLNYDRSAPLVLFTKGDPTSTTGAYYQLVLHMNGLVSQLCFNAQAPTPGVGAGNIVLLNICTDGAADAMPNGFNYDLAVTNDGGGWLTDFMLWVNGLPIGGSGAPGASNTALFNLGFNPATFTITNGGSGYAASTNYTSTGGGPHCVLTGSVSASGGVITSIGRTQASGCTSSPTIVLTAPTGTGATFSATAFTSTLKNPSPLLIGGPSGMSTDSGQAAVNVDEAAIFSSALSNNGVTNIYYWTQFFQNIIGSSPPAVSPVLFVDNDTSDPDNQYALAAAIGLHLRRYLTLQGLAETEGDQVCEQMWQQMLNQAGLNHVPMSTSATSYSGAPNCLTADINTYNASTLAPPLNSSTAVYRKVFAANPTRPIYVQLTGHFTAMSEFMQSPPDSISSLTGQQLLDRNAANGGAIFAQGLGCITATNYIPTPCSATVTGDNSLADPVAGQYVVSHNGATPIYFYGGIPASTGLGDSRVAKDPLLLYAQSHVFVRQAYDSLALSGMITPVFARGVFLTVSGGTGYANLTPFNSTGGGSECSVSGFMVSSSGVPTGFQSTWGTTQDTYSGLGSGCTSTPTINLIGAAGTGATITAASTVVCGTVTITTGGTPTATISSATCSNHYFLPYSLFAQSPGNGTTAPILGMFLNSLIDPPPSGQPRIPN